MAKNIIVCSDGTGNSAIKGRGTNVFKLFEAIDLNGHRHDPELDPQVAFYDDGVGTERFKLLKIFAGATGWGLSRNVRQLYKEIARIHDPGDRIFLFGFSRGAFTARTLVGLIHTCGLLDGSRYKTADALEAAVREAYRLYRKNYQTALAKLFRKSTGSSQIEAFRRENCIKEDVNISFVGVWDTVDAVGLPFHISDFINFAIHRFKFPDHNLSPCVKRACHALAVDDERHSFHPLLWNANPRIEQVWFAGAHSNVGGGYPKQGMSLVTLDWMLAKAEEVGLRLVASERVFYREHANLDDKLYNPRAGLGMFYRWKPRDISAICTKSGISPVLHSTLLERIAHGTEDYTPGNVPLDAEVAITPTHDNDENRFLKERAESLKGVLQKASKEGRPLFERVRSAIFAGRVSYYVALFASLGAVAAAVGGEAFKKPWLIVAILCGYLVSWTLAVAVNRRMSDVFSEFWHGKQLDLRNALKRARQSGEEEAAA